MKRYEKYKDSGVEWIGEIPSHWEVVPLKYTGSFGNGLTYSPKDVCDNGILVLRSSNIQNSHIDYVDCVYVNSAPVDLMVKKGDIIICSRNGSAALVGKCAIVNEDISATFGAFMMRYIPFINNRFAYFLFQTAICFYKGLFATTTINQLTKNVIDQMFVSLPSKEEQAGIANYLDAKCGKIDKVIAVQEKRVELLRELKQSIITRAVTRGIPSTSSGQAQAKMKDSGVEWIGEIPEHWELWKVGRLVPNIGSGTTPSTGKADYYSEDGINWLQTGDLNDGVITETTKHITSKAVKECGLKIYPSGSLVIAMYGATIGKLGLLSIETATNQACCVLPPNNAVLNTLLRYTFVAAKQSLIDKSVGGGQSNISQEIIKNSRIPVPPLAEQQQIVTYIEQQTSRLDSSIAKALRQIELLKEYKQSLITEVVTGKRRVC